MSPVNYSRIDDLNGVGQIQEILQTSVLEFQPDCTRANLRRIKGILRHEGSCCLLASTPDGKVNWYKLISLLKAIISFKKIQRELNACSSSFKSSLIGVYPSVKYPKCIYEINSNAEKYSLSNIMPNDGVGIKCVIKKAAKRILGVSTSVGGVGLIIYRD